MEQGQRPDQRLLEVTKIRDPEEVATRLDVDERTLVIVRRRLFLVEDQPVALCDSYYPAAMVEGTAIAEPRRIRGGAMAVIEDPAGPIGRVAARSVDELTSQMPTHPEIDKLRLWTGVPVMRILRTIYDTEGVALEVQDSVAAALATHCARAAGSTTRESLWAAAAALHTSTMFGAFRIDPASGTQLGHETALVRWTAHSLVRPSCMVIGRNAKPGHS